MAGPDDAVIEVGRAGGVVVVRLLRPDHTSAYANKLRTALYGLADHGHALRVVLDLEELTVSASGLLGVLVTFQRKLGANAGALRLCSVSPAARESFAATRLDQMFSIYPAVGPAADW